MKITTAMLDFVEIMFKSGPNFFSFRAIFFNLVVHFFTFVVRFGYFDVKNIDFVVYFLYNNFVFLFRKYNITCDGLIS